MMVTKQPMPAPIPPSPTPPLDTRVVNFICPECGLIAFTRHELESSSLSEPGYVPMARPCRCGRLARRAALK